MSTELPSNYTEAELLYHYIGERMSNAGRDTPLEDLLSGFVQYRRELQDLRTKLRAAEASSARGESKELDVESLIAEKEIARQPIDEHRARQALSHEEAVSERREQLVEPLGSPRVAQHARGLALEHLGRDRHVPVLLEGG